MPLLMLGGAAEAERSVNTDSLAGEIEQTLFFNRERSVKVRDKRLEAAAAERSIVEALEESLKKLAKGEDRQVDEIQKIATDVRNLAAVQQEQTAATDGLIRQVIENQTAERESLQRLTAELNEAVPTLNKIKEMDARVERIGSALNTVGAMDARVDGIDRKVDGLSLKLDALISMLPPLRPPPQSS